MQSPGSKNNSKKRAEKGPAQRLRQRTAILILLILVLGFGAAVLRLTYLTTVQSSELQESAVDLQLADTTVSAKRGTIYDRNGTVERHYVTKGSQVHLVSQKDSFHNRMILLVNESLQKRGLDSLYVVNDLTGSNLNEINLTMVNFLDQL